MMPDQARRAYIHHDVENPALSEATYPARMTPATIERAAVEETKALLAGTIAKGGLGRAIPNIPQNERKIAGAILACWSLVHGLTMLLADGLVGPRKKYDKLSDSVVQSMLDGLTSKLPALPPRTWLGPQRSF